jgi:hypothetical protein
VEFSGVDQSLEKTYALVVMHGAVGTGYYLDYNQPLGGTGGIVSLGPLAAGSHTFTFDYQYAPFETPVGVIIAGFSEDSLDMGVSAGFLAQNPLWLSPSLPFAVATGTLSLGEPVNVIATNINNGTAGLDPFLNRLADLPLATSAFIPFTADSTGTLVDFPALDGQSNGVITVNPTAATPLPSSFWTGLTLMVGLAFASYARKARAIA